MSVLEEERNRHSAEIEARQASARAAAASTPVEPVEASRLAWGEDVPNPTPREAELAAPPAPVPAESVEDSRAARERDQAAVTAGKASGLTESEVRYGTPARRIAGIGAV